MSTRAATKSGALVSWKRRLSGLAIFFALFLFCATAAIMVQGFLLGGPPSSLNPELVLTGLLLLGIVVFAAAALPAIFLLVIFGIRGAPSLLECILAGIFTGMVFTKWQADFNDIYFNIGDALLYGSIGLLSSLAAWLFWRLPQGPARPVLGKAT